MSTLYFYFVTENNLTIYKNLCTDTEIPIYTFNAFHAAGECRRQVKKLAKFVKNVDIVEFHDYIRNHNEKGIQISTNMPGIGSLIRKIAVEISEIWESKQTFAQ